MMNDLLWLTRFQMLMSSRGIDCVLMIEIMALKVSIQLMMVSNLGTVRGEVLGYALNREIMMTTECKGFQRIVKWT